MSATNDHSQILDRRAVLAALRARANTPEQLERLGQSDSLELASELGASRDQGERELGRALMLARVSQVVNSSLELDVVLRNVLDLAVEFMHAQRGFLMLQNAQTGELELSVVHNFDRETLASDDLKISYSIVNRVFESHEPILTSDAQEDPRFNAQQSIMALHIRSIVCAPLLVKDRAIGVCYLDSRVMPGLFTRQDPQLLHSLASRIDRKRRHYPRCLTSGCDVQRRRRADVRRCLRSDGWKRARCARAFHARNPRADRPIGRPPRSPHRVARAARGAW